MTPAWSIVMKSVVEHCVDNARIIVITEAMEHCEENGMVLCDDKGHGAL